jgi:uncharacterized membrane protein YbhN (UPF0104 family)
MENSLKPKSPARKRWLLLLKILVTAFCLWFVSTRIDLAAIGRAFTRVSLGWVLLALALYIFSKIISAFRLNIYFRNLGIVVSEPSNLKLYWLGMFYNLFLPGSIGGDAYKMVMLSKKFNKPYRQTGSALLLDRFSGLAGLFLLLAVFGFVVLGVNTWTLVFLLACLLGTAFFYWIIRRWMPAFLPGFLPTFLLGLLVQVIQAGAVYGLMAGMNIPLSEQGYLLLFLLSSVASVLPISIGGLGLREIVFWKGSAWLALSEENAVMISLLFFVITLIASIPGLFFIFSPPLVNPEKK